MPKKEEKLDTKKAEEVLKKEREERVQKCSAEIRKVLQEHDCSLSVAMIVSQDGNRPQINVVPN